MNRDIFEGNWKQVKGSLKAKWGKLTDDDLKRIEGNSEEAVGRLQERYCKKKEEAERDWKEFQKSWQKEQHG